MTAGNFFALSMQRHVSAEKLSLARSSLQPRIFLCKDNGRKAPLWPRRDQWFRDRRSIGSADFGSMYIYTPSSLLDYPSNGRKSQKISARPAPIVRLSTRGGGEGEQKRTICLPFNVFPRRRGRIASFCTQTIAIIAHYMATHVRLLLHNFGTLGEKRIAIFK